MMLMDPDGAPALMMDKIIEMPEDEAAARKYVSRHFGDDGVEILQALGLEDYARVETKLGTSGRKIYA